ncbi:MAG: uridine kinase [Pseudomonadota bacterium]
MIDETLEPLVLAIAGGSCSGKTILSRLIHERLGTTDSVYLQLDRYYKPVRIKNDTQMDLPNFDHPEALDLTLFEQHVAALKQGQSIQAPIYDFAAHRRQEHTEAITPKPFIVLEGHLLLHDPQLRELYDLSCYIECNEHIRLERRITRDLEQRGRSEESVRQQFEQTVAPMHNQFVSPSKTHAHLVIAQERYCSSTDALVDSILAELKGHDVPTARAAL